METSNCQRKSWSPGFTGGRKQGSPDTGFPNAEKEQEEDGCHCFCCPGRLALSEDPWDGLMGKRAHRGHEGVQHSEPESWVWKAQLGTQVCWASTAHPEGCQAGDLPTAWHTGISVPPVPPGFSLHSQEGHVAVLPLGHAQLTLRGCPSSPVAAPP